jgi:hypothetical protein
VWSYTFVSKFCAVGGKSVVNKTKLGAEIDNLRHAVQFGSYLICFIYSVLGTSIRRHLPKNQRKPCGSTWFIIYILCEGHFLDLKHIGNWYNNRTVFKTKHTLRHSHMRTRPKGDTQQIYSSACDYVRSCVGETGCTSPQKWAQSQWVYSRRI